MEKITSVKNDKIKGVVKLREAKERKQKNLIIIEGQREIALAIAGGINLSTLFVCPEFGDDKYLLLNKVNQSAVIELGRDVFQKIAYREHPDGYLALAEPQNHGLAELKVGRNPLIIVLENVEKPGNLGAILRTADAAGADAVIVCDPATDVYNPNVIRASQGTVFTVPVAVCKSAEAIKWLDDKKIPSYSAALSATKNYVKMDYKQPTAFIFGTEDKGLSDEWLRATTEQIIIPMKGKIDSLNVSNSVAIMVYEAVRQREI